MDLLARSFFECSFHHAFADVCLPVQPDSLVKAEAVLYPAAMARSKLAILPVCRSVLALLVAANAVLASRAATPNSAPEKDLRAALLDHELYLRDFNAARSPQWHWDGSAFLPDSTPPARAIAALELTHIDIKHDVLILEGMRRLLLRDNSTLQLDPKAIPVRLLITVPHAQQAAALPELPGLLFFPNREAAVAAIPPAYSSLLPGSSQPPQPALEEKCDCADLGQPACQGKRPSRGLTIPKLQYSVDPEFSEEARHAKISGDVTLVFTVDTSGRVKDPWIARAVGKGLDEAALTATNQYVFAPGLCHGQPATVPIATDVNFQIF